MDATGYGLDGLWACQCSTHVPLHVIQVFLRLLSVPFLFDCVISRLDAGPSNYVARTVCADGAPCHLLKESLQVVPVKGSPAWYALSISDKQGCDCYSVGLPVRAQNQVLEVGLDVPQQAAGMRMHANAYECVRMHTNTCECIRMHANAYDCICVHM